MLSMGTMEEVESFENAEKQYLKDFIRTWETYPELWNTSIDAYRDKAKKNTALEKLLDIYKLIKPNSTKEDVKKKLNSLRTNFRKEFKKIHWSKSSGRGTNKVYCPTSWTYHELVFLMKDEQPIINKTSEENDDDQPMFSMDPPPFPVKHKRKKEKDHHKLLERTVSYLEKDEQEEEYFLAKVWTNKLKKLEPDQKILAEKAVNDILFEAQIGKLTKNSVKINVDYSQTSTSLTDTHTSPTTQQSVLPHYIEHIDQTVVTTGTPSQIILRPCGKLNSYQDNECNVSQDNILDDSIAKFFHSFQ